MALPELEAAAASNWNPRDYRVPVGWSAAPVVSDQRSMPPLASATLNASVTFPTPGYYRLLITARDRSTAPQVLDPDGTPIQPEVLEERWILITEVGGRLTTTFDEDILPAGARPQPGPLGFYSAKSGLSEKGVRAGSVQASVLAVLLGAPRRLLDGLRHRLAHSEDARLPLQDYTYQALYLDRETGQNVPIKGAKARITVTEVDAWGEQSTFTYTRWTNSTGHFTVLCEPTSPSIPIHGFSIDLLAETATVRVRQMNTSLNQYRLGTNGDDFDDCNAGVNLNRQLIGRSNPARVFDNFNNIVISNAVSQFNRSRGQITVKLDTVCSGTSCGAQYFSASDEIEIKGDPDGGGTPLSNHIWGAFGDLIAGHEYGHAFQNKAMGGPFKDATSNCEPHFFDQDSSYGCAVAEGFASYFGWAVHPGASAFPVPFGGPETAHLDVQSGNDRPQTESTTAAFLWDIRDPINETWDNLALTDKYIGDVVASCKYQSGNQWFKASGIDHVIFCFEAGFDNAEHDAHFPSRSWTVLTQETVTEPTGWNEAKMRTLWHRNVFNIAG